MPRVRSIDVTDEASFGRIPPCADGRFDHRTCDYWEDADRGSKLSRPAWLQPTVPRAAPPGPPADNPFARPRGASEPEANPFSTRAPAQPPDAFDPFASAAIAASLDPLAGTDLFVTPAWNPFAPTPPAERSRGAMPRKLALLDRGRGVFGSYAKVAAGRRRGGGLRPVRAAVGLSPGRPPPLRSIRALPAAPLPAVITCIATTAAGRRGGHARHLVGDVCRDLARRGFAAVEAYPDLTLPSDETSAATPGFWLGCGFALAVDDERFPVMRRELE